MPGFDAEYDVIVLGTGAAGLTAAVAAADPGDTRVGLFEKSEQVGGTTAWSIGQVWIPNNSHVSDLGVSDSREQALTYIMSLSRDLLDPELIEAYVDTGPQMVDWLESNTPVQFNAVPMPDYHPEFPGGSVGGGRTLECPLFAFAELGDWADRVTASPYYGNPHITISETPLGSALPEPPSRTEIARRQENQERGCGQALVGRLLRACLDRGVAPQTEHGARELIIEDNRVIGVVLETPRGNKRVHANKGVVLACGGFEWNEALRQSFLRGPMTHPISVPTNTGDGLRMSMKAGAMLANMREAWWIPVATLPPQANAMQRFAIASQRTLPHSIMVNKRGQRFTNEAANYNAFGAAFHAEDVSRFEYANLPCWLVFDENYAEKYGFRVAAGMGKHKVPQWLTRAATLSELAAQLGIDGEALTATVDRWNTHCERGHDPDYLRGESAFDRWWGDPTCRDQINATLGPLNQGPYYAVEIHSGALGTKGGPQVDRNGRVMSVDGEPIPGLYAAGNAMGSPFGMTYGGAGGTIGPAMVFGYLAARHAIARND